MNRPLIVLGIAGFALAGCASTNIAANLRDIQNAITAGERNLVTLCQGMPPTAVAATTIACIARANGTTQDIIGRTIAAAQAVCSGATQPPSVQSALNQLMAAAQAATIAQSAGCQ